MRVILLFIKTLLAFVVLFCLAIGGLLIYGTLTDFQPEEKIELKADSKQKLSIEADSTLSFSLLIWNIGYCGLGAEMDFFYDEGENVITPPENVEKYRNFTLETLSKQTETDFILLQEVDLNSKRSNNINQRTLISEKSLPNYNATTALNYKVDWIPYPFYEPMGKVEGGLVSYSKYTSTENTRFQFPGNYSWPTRLYMLDRCFLLQRFKLPSGKDLVIINTHNSAYDDGSLKSRQMDYLKNILLAEYGKGNYVVVGGDWNQTPPGYDNRTFQKGEDYIDQISIEKDFMPQGWQWAYDGTTPTNRKTSKPYDANTTFQTVIDFFLVSPNISVTKTKGINLDFVSSDHQPVYMEIELK